MSINHCLNLLELYDVSNTCIQPILCVMRIQEFHGSTTINNSFVRLEEKGQQTCFRLGINLCFNDCQIDQIPDSFFLALLGI